MSKIAHSDWLMRPSPESLEGQKVQGQKRKKNQKDTEVWLR